MLDNMAFCIAEKSDLPLLFALEKQAFGEHGYPAFFFRQAFDCWPDGLMMIKEASNLFGYLLLVPATPAGNDAWVLSLAVSPQARRKGIAKALLTQAIKRSCHCERLLLTVCPNNTAALNLYLSLGFTVIDKEDDYFAPGEARLKLAYIYNKS